MEKVTLIIKKTYIDDSDASTKIEVKMCESVETAKASILKTLNNDFETDCKSLGELSNLLSVNMFDSSSNEVEADCPYVFYWYDNGKGEDYKILEVSNNGEYVFVSM